MTLYELRAHGIRAELLPGGRVKLIPASRVTPEIVEAVKGSKSEIVRELRVQQTWREISVFWQNAPAPVASGSLQGRIDNVSDRLTSCTTEHRFCRLCRVFTALNTRQLVTDHVQAVFPGAQEVRRYDA